MARRFRSSGTKITTCNVHGGRVVKGTGKNGAVIEVTTDCYEDRCWEIDGRIK